MERTGFLIEKLLDDYRNSATPAQLLVTLQLIQKELVVQNIQVGKRISIVMPGQVHESFADDPGEITLSYKEMPEPEHEPEPVAIIPEPVIQKREEEPIPAPVPVVEKRAETIEKPVVIHQQPDPVPEVTVQPVIKEIKQDINETMAVNGKSLNELLGAGEKEVAEVLTGGPIKDLRKGIGMNDRFVFVNDLFRGDETMYERSVKTINGFNIYAEAQYWMERELKIKLGWNDNQPVVKQFYALVRRRFS